MITFFRCSDESKWSAISREGGELQTRRRSPRLETFASNMPEEVAKNRPNYWTTLRKRPWKWYEPWREIRARLIYTPREEGWRSRVLTLKASAGSQKWERFRFGKRRLDWVGGFWLAVDGAANDGRGGVGVGRRWRGGGFRHRIPTNHNQQGTQERYRADHQKLWGPSGEHAKKRCEGQALGSTTPALPLWSAVSRTRPAGRRTPHQRTAVGRTVPRWCPELAAWSRGDEIHGVSFQREVVNLRFR